MVGTVVGVSQCWCCISYVQSKTDQTPRRRSGPEFDSLGDGRDQEESSLFYPLPSVVLKQDFLGEVSSLEGVGTGERNKVKKESERRVLESRKDVR